MDITMNELFSNVIRACRASRHTPAAPATWHQPPYRWPYIFQECMGHPTCFADAYVSNANRVSEF